MPRAATLTLTLLAFTVLPLAAQGPSPATDTTASRHLAGIDRSLQRIATLLERQVEIQAISVAFKRVELASTLQARTEERLAKVRSRRETVAEEHFHLEGQLTQVAEELESGDTGLTAEEADRMVTYTEKRLERLEELRRDADRQTLELENELAERRRETERWQDEVDRRLAASDGTDDGE